MIFANISYFAKIANLARIDERVAKNSDKVAKKGLLIISDFFTDGHVGRIHERFAQNSNEMTKKAISEMVIFHTWPIFAKKR